MKNAQIIHCLNLHSGKSLSLPSVYMYIHIHQNLNTLCGSFRLIVQTWIQTDRQICLDTIGFTLRHENTKVHPCLFRFQQVSIPADSFHVLQRSSTLISLSPPWNNMFRSNPSVYCNSSRRNCWRKWSIRIKYIGHYLMIDTHWFTNDTEG